MWVATESHRLAGRPRCEAATNQRRGRKSSPALRDSVDHKRVNGLGVAPEKQCRMASTAGMSNSEGFAEKMAHIVDGSLAL
jgi:hypothetical protein